VNLDKIDNMEADGLKINSSNTPKYSVVYQVASSYFKKIYSCLIKNMEKNA